MPMRRASQGTRRAPHGRDINHTDQHHRPEVCNTQRNRREPPRRSTQVGPLHDHTEIGRFLYLGAAAVAMRHLGVCARSVRDQRAAGRPRRWSLRRATPREPSGRAGGHGGGVRFGVRRTVRQCRVLSGPKRGPTCGSAVAVCLPLPSSTATCTRLPSGPSRRKPPRWTSLNSQAKGNEDGTAVRCTKASVASNLARAK